MPKIRRWFPVSHDINSDPEMWEMRNTIGERSLGIWLEILSLGDRNGGLVGPLSDASATALAFKCHSSAVKVRQVWDYALTQAWMVCDPVPRLSKFLEYHKTRGTNQIPSGILTTPSLPNLPNLPNLKEDTLVDASADDRPQLKLVKSEEPKPDMSVQEFVESWNDVFAGTLPQVVWPLSPTRQRKAAMRLKEHREMDFWRQVFRHIMASDFLTGKKSGWKCNFDFLIQNDTNAVKIFEGVYANGANESRRSFNR